MLRSDGYLSMILFSLVFFCWLETLGDFPSLFLSHFPFAVFPPLFVVACQAFAPVPPWTEPEALFISSPPFPLKSVLFFRVFCFIYLNYFFLWNAHRTHQDIFTLCFCLLCCILSFLRSGYYRFLSPSLELCLSLSFFVCKALQCQCCLSRRMVGSLRLPSELCVLLVS